MNTGSLSSLKGRIAQKAVYISSFRSTYIVFCTQDCLALLSTRLSWSAIAQLCYSLKLLIIYTSRANAVAIWTTSANSIRFITKWPTQHTRCFDRQATKIWTAGSTISRRSKFNSFIIIPRCWASIMCRYFTAGRDREIKTNSWNEAKAMQSICPTGHQKYLHTKAK